MDAEDAACLAHVAQLPGQAEEAQPEPIEHVIIDHGAGPPAHRFRHDKHGVTALSLTRRSRAQVSGELGDCSP